MSLACWWPAIGWRVICSCLPAKSYTAISAMDGAKILNSPALGLGQREMVVSMFLAADTIGMRLLVTARLAR